MYLFICVYGNLKAVRAEFFSSIDTYYKQNISLTILSSPVWVLVIFFVICSNGVLVLHVEASSSDQPYRTAYHFQPPSGWMNDPNGPMRYMGVYHLFYQSNLWDHVVWGHSVSNDLVNWTPLDSAIFPSQPLDINGRWSGSTPILAGGKPAILYTGIDSSSRQVQNLAYPTNFSDPFLREWVKSPQNPLIEPRISDNIDAGSFRDPTTAWFGQDGYWRVLIGSQNRPILYRSKDFLSWIKANETLFSAEGSGMWECPDFFPVLIKNSSGVDVSVNGPHVRHVLKAILAAKQHDYYLIGTYDAAKDVFVPDIKIENASRFDYGQFYASKSFFDDGKSRRVLFSWIRESSSLVAIPRSIWLHKSGKQMEQWPVVEIEELRGNLVNLSPKILKGGEMLQVNNVTASQADVEISFDVKEFGKAEVLNEWMDPQILCNEKGANVTSGLGPFGLLVFASSDLLEYTAVFFRIFKYQNQNVVLMFSDQSRSSLNKDNDLTTYGTFVDMDPLQEKMSLRSLIDHSEVESFGGEGRGCITARVYPTLEINDKANLYAFNNGTVDVNITKLSAWSMKRAQINGI